MKKIIFSIIFLILCQNILCQTFKTYWEEYAVDNNTDSLISDRGEKKYFLYFLINNQRDTIFMSNPSSIEQKEQFTHRLTIKTSNNKANLLIWNKVYTDTISMYFDNEKMIIRVNNCDDYFLDKNYYSFLKKRILKEKNINRG